ncbi:MAG TPA: hypothetical protein VMI54_23915 [Polyangiaceae bacterium]|nr:hypothetical protein [Polyangiaceae bacterium]
MSTVHLVGGEKGGVGKSVVARLLSQLFIDRGLAFAALDADQSHGALRRSYADYTQPVDLGRLESADQILDRALGADRRVVVDLPAQSHRALRRWVDATDVLAYAREMDVRLVLWHVTDGGFDSVAQLEKLVDDFGGAVEYVVVKNEGRSRDFSQLEASPAYQRLLALRARVVTLPELDPAIMYKVDRSSSSFWAAVNANEGDRALAPLERRRAKLWLERAEAALSEAADVHGLAEHAPSLENHGVFAGLSNDFVNSDAVN